MYVCIWCSSKFSKFLLKLFLFEFQLKRGVFKLGYAV